MCPSFSQSSPLSSPYPIYLAENCTLRKNTQVTLPSVYWGWGRGATAEFILWFQEPGALPQAAPRGSVCSWNLGTFLLHAENRGTGMHSSARHCHQETPESGPGSGVDANALLIAHVCDPLGIHSLLTHNL